MFLSERSVGGSRDFEFTECLLFYLSTFTVMDRTPTDTDVRSFGSRLRERLGSISPFSLAMLGFIGFLGDAFTQLEVLQTFHLF